MRQEEIEQIAKRTAEEVAKQMSDEMLHHSPVSAHCENVLAKLEAGEIPCYDFRMSRSAVLCLAWKMLEEQKLQRLPTGRAWQVLRQKCRTE